MRCCIGVGEVARQQLIIAVTRRKDRTRLRNATLVPRQPCISNVVSLQVTIAGGVGHQQVKKLAYDLCKAVPLLPSDYSLIVDGIKVCGLSLAAPDQYSTQKQAAAVDVLSTGERPACKLRLVACNSQLGVPPLAPARLHAAFFRSAIHYLTPHAPLQQPIHP